MHINFNAHITSRNHYTVSFTNNIINIINALGIFGCRGRFFAML